MGWLGREPPINRPAERFTVSPLAFGPLIANLRAMPDIVLATLNAKFIHAAFGLRYLFANLADLQPRAAIAEFDINQRPLDIVEVLLAGRPEILGLGVYIWNVVETTEVVGTLKRIRPEIKIILGGPEVSYETEVQEIVRLADHVITGEGDLKFAEVCRKLLECRSPTRPAGAGDQTGAALPKIIPAELPDFSRLEPPYEFYTAADIAHRIVYVEASRGCPFTCEFCLSSLDIPVRAVPLENFLGEMQKLLDRGLKQFKFVDRTFNLNIATSKAILEFFLARHRPGNFYHFEMIPDRLPAELRQVIARFPPGALQFEVGVQTFNPDVGQNISRRQNYERLADNFNFLRHETRVHIHADLIVGLPGETVESFAAGFDRLIALGPQEIQVGILKRLRGTPIVRHDAQWQMIYHPQPPYEILQNRLIDFATMQRLRRFAKYWDLIGNSGNFVATTPLVWRDASPFANFLRLSDWLYVRLGRTDTIALARLAELLFDFLTGELELETTRVAEAMAGDWQRTGRRDVPEFLREFLTAASDQPAPVNKTSLPKRQARHLAGNSSE
jgi:radical SAM superfamily enzyme YgiQ (UPF0313 family)